ncbi:hypothetical protein AB3K78_11355 [Leucobacter sp. HNU]|uniref:hypothetical protein n=1 Tax=Leucobacter sp. HNU TaxID=3236805 RepID=UPI003A8016D9
MSTASSSPRTGARAAGRRVDRWFRELGLPTFVPLRRWFIDLPRRVAPLVTAVTILAALSDDQFDRAIDEAVRLVPEVDDGQWIVVTIVLVVLAILAALAWTGYRLVRAAMRRLSPAVGNAVGVALILVCLGLMIVGGYLAKPGATVGPMFSAVATVLVCMLITGMGGGALLSWGARLAVRNAAAVGHMASIALPVILMLVVFAFFSAEVWQMASALHWGSIALVGVVVGALALVVVLRVCASEIDDMGRVLGADERGRLLQGTPAGGRPGAELAPSRPLRLIQRINLLLVMAVAQLMQALLFAALLWSLLMIIGGIAVPVGVVELWVGPGTPAHPLHVERLVVGGATLPITVNLVKSAAVLSIISTLPFVFSAVSEARYRERFFDPIMADIRRAIVVRDALLAKPGAQGSAVASEAGDGTSPRNDR